MNIFRMKDAVITVIEDICKGLPKQDYKEFLENLIGDLQIRVEAVTDEIEEAGED